MSTCNVRDPAESARLLGDKTPDVALVDDKEDRLVTRDVEAYGSVLDQGKPVQEGVSIGMMIIIALPRMAINMAWAAQWAAFGPYLGTMLPDFAVQLTMIIAPVTGILAGSTIGMISDQCTSKWGRRRPFLMWAAIATSACWVVMAFAREIGEALGDYGTGKPGERTSRKWTAALTIFLYAWMDVALNILQTPAYLLMADMAGDRQTTGASIGQGFSTLGSIVISLYIAMFGPAHNSLGYFLTMISIVMLGSVAVVCYVAKETPLKAQSSSGGASVSMLLNSFNATIRAIAELPRTLIVVYFVNLLATYGSIAYTGNKGQFFGFVLFNGNAKNADSCGNACTPAQQNYNRGVQLAGGSTDMMFNILSYVTTWILPSFITKYGVKWVLVVSQLPQVLLMVMAFCNVVSIDVAIVVLTSIPPTVVGALIIPIIINVLGSKTDIGVYVGALNTACCLGLLFSFAAGAALVQTPLGYRLPVFLGGVMSLLGVFVTVAFLKLKMYSL